MEGEEIQRPLAGVQTLSLFAGAGGLDYGFHEAGAELVCAYETNASALLTYARNFAKEPRHERAETAGTLASEQSVDLILAGPPCQGFSNIGKRDVDDPRNSGLLATAGVLARLRPQAFVVENVRGLLSLAGGTWLQRFKDIIAGAGLHLRVVKADSSHLGVPQRRRRVFLVGGQGRIGSEFASVAESSLRPAGELVVRTVGDVLLPVSSFEGLPNHRPAAVQTEWYRRVIKRIGPGQKLCDTRLGDSSVHSWDLPEVFGATSSSERELLRGLARLRRSEVGRDYAHIGDGRPVRLEALSTRLNIGSSEVRRLCDRLAEAEFIRYSGTDFVDLKRKFNGRFKRLSADRPSQAVVKEFAHARNVLHPTEDRALTVRECAALQTFPSDFVFVGSKSEQYSQVANAVPPRVSCVLAAALAKVVLSRGNVGAA